MKTIVAGVLLVLTGTTISADARSASVIATDVAFPIVNRNDSMVPCESDGLPYTVRGRLVSPSDARGITIYLHGAGNARSWNLRAMPAYDHIARMGALGHASLFLDQLGYGSSDIPDGTAVCAGSQADIAAQIAARLRSGDYTASHISPRRFGRVALAGHSQGASIAEVAAGSFPDAFDALVVAGWSDTPHPRVARVMIGISKQVVRCGVGDDKQGRPGYAYGLDPEEIGEALFANAEPAVIEARRPDGSGIHAGSTDRRDSQSWPATRSARRSRSRS